MASKLIDPHNFSPKSPIVLMTGGFAPLHLGHVRSFEDAKSLTGADLLVGVMCDAFLMKKHGYIVQGQDERASMVASIGCVDYVAIIESDTLVDQFIREIRPKFFGNGGDRNSIETAPRPEVLACEEVGCTMLWGVGGTEKINSSSKIVEKIIQNEYVERIRKMQEQLDIKDARIKSLESGIMRREWEWDQFKQSLKETM